MIKTVGGGFDAQRMDLSSEKLYLSSYNSIITAFYLVNQISAIWEKTKRKRRKGHYKKWLRYSRLLHLLRFIFLTSPNDNQGRK